MLAKTFGLKFVAIAIAAAWLLGAAGGYALKDRLCDAATALRDKHDALAKAERLQKELTAERTAAKNSAKELQFAQQRLEKAEGAFREIESKVADGECFDAATVDGLRDALWGR
jgi:uncharacterized protein HemX